jgi:hypothetical protein
MILLVSVFMCKIIETRFQLGQNPGLVKALEKLPRSSSYNISAGGRRATKLLNFPEHSEAMR